MFFLILKMPQGVIYAIFKILKRECYQPMFLPIPEMPNGVIYVDTETTRCLFGSPRVRGTGNKSFGGYPIEVLFTKSQLLLISFQANSSLDRNMT